MSAGFGPCGLCVCNVFARGCSRHKLGLARFLCCCNAMPFFSARAPFSAVASTCSRGDFTRRLRAREVFAAVFTETSSSRAGTSLTKDGGPSTPAAEWAGKAKRLAAYARLAPAAKKEDQRRAKAADTAPRGGTLLARARASRCTKSTASGLKRPPTSSARTTSLQRESGRRSSGYVRSLARRAWRRAAPSALFW